MYIESILYYLTWPLLVIVSWYGTKWVLKKFEQNRQEAEAGE